MISALAESECRSARHGLASSSFAALRRPAVTRPTVSPGAGELRRTGPLHCGPAILGRRSRWPSWAFLGLSRPLEPLGQATGRLIVAGPNKRPFDAGRATRMRDRGQGRIAREPGVVVGRVNKRARGEPDCRWRQRRNCFSPRRRSLEGRRGPRRRPRQAPGGGLSSRPGVGVSRPGSDVFERQSRLATAQGHRGGPLTLVRASGGVGGAAPSEFK